MYDSKINNLYINIFIHPFQYTSGYAIYYIYIYIYIYIYYIYIYYVN